MMHWDGVNPGSGEHVMPWDGVNPPWPCSTPRTEVTWENAMPLYQLRYQPRPHQNTKPRRYSPTISLEDVWLWRPPCAVFRSLLQTSRKSWDQTQDWRGSILLAQEPQPGPAPSSECWLNTQSPGPRVFYAPCRSLDLCSDLIGLLWRLSLLIFGWNSLKLRDRRQHV